MDTINFTPRRFARTIDEPCTPELEAFADSACREIGSLYPLEGDARDEVICGILKFLDEDRQRIGDEKRSQAWLDGWRENLYAYRNSDSDANLVPKFIRPGQPVRFQGNYAKTSHSDFEHLYYRLLRAWIAHRYFANVDEVHEYGAGTGWNLLAMARMFPLKSFRGFDFVATAVDLINLVGATTSLDIRGDFFDFRRCGDVPSIDKRVGVYTCGALEQTASVIEPFVHWLLAWPVPPGVVVHLEPVPELMSENTLFDYLGRRFLDQRGYSRGLLPCLRQLQQDGRVDIDKVTRTGVGSLRMEGYNLIVWRPRR